MFSFNEEEKGQFCRKEKSLISSKRVISAEGIVQSLSSLLKSRGSSFKEGGKEGGRLFPLLSRREKEERKAVLFTKKDKRSYILRIGEESKKRESFYHVRRGGVFF